MRRAIEMLQKVILVLRDSARFTNLVSIAGEVSTCFIVVKGDSRQTGRNSHCFLSMEVDDCWRLGISRIFPDAMSPHRHKHAEISSRNRECLIRLDAASQQQATRRWITQLLHPAIGSPADSRANSQHGAVTGSAHHHRVHQLVSWAAKWRCASLASSRTDLASSSRNQIRRLKDFSVVGDGCLYNTAYHSALHTWLNKTKTPVSFEYIKKLRGLSSWNGLPRCLPRANTKTQTARIAGSTHLGVRIGKRFEEL
ncbi:hypothetical protein J3F83DRAFT_542768 [Trichoderma novae-zelandiae]